VAHVELSVVDSGTPEREIRSRGGDG